MNKEYTGFEITEKAYDSSREHLADELKRLDLLLRLCITREQQPEESNQFAGLALSAEEIYNLLGGGSFLGCDDSILVDELARLNFQIEKRLEASLREETYLALPHISKMLNLSSFEEQCIIICLAPELDRKYEKIYAYFQNDMTAKSPSIDFVLQLLAVTDEEKISARLAFDLQAPLMKFLMETGGNMTDNRIPLIARPLKLDDWAVNFLLGFQVLDARLMQMAEMISAGGTGENTELTDIEKNVVRFVNHYRSGKKNKTKQIFYFYGPRGAGKKGHALTVCNSLGLPLVIMDIEKILVSDMPFNEILRLLGRQTMLEDAALCLENFDSLLTEDGRHQVKINMLLQMITTHAPLTFVLGQAPWSPGMLDAQTTFVEVEFSFPAESKRKAFWEKFSQNHKLVPEIDLNDFSGKFRFTPGQIQEALKRGENLAIWNASGHGQIDAAGLYDACHAQSNRKLSSLAQKINVNYNWDMLVLPSDQMSQLREICNQLKYRSVVYGEWGFEKRLSLGKGLNVLFSGPPGSGKTMAAEVIAKELSLELYKIDVSQVVSKYIGETEKNLAKIFAEAETSNAILFFDEADALFGKRSEVKDAHDRYANVETSYLLQKMEEYKGIVILATNFHQNIDEAFLRRLHFNVEFPFPEKEQRRKIWTGMFPAGAPLSQDIDFDFMCDKFILAGGNIKNIALNAAFYAAHDSGPIGMKHIMLAAKREYKKLSKTFLKSDFAPYYELIEVI